MQGLQAMPFSSLFPKGISSAGSVSPKVSEAGEGCWGVRPNPAVASAIHCVHVSKGPETGPETEPDLETEKCDCFFVLKSKKVSEKT